MEYTQSILQNGTYLIKDRKYDSMLSIIIPGEPLVDTRPRVMGSFAFTENKNLIVSIFKEYYKFDEVLKNLTIQGEYALYIDGYFSITKKDLKLLQRYFDKDYKLFIKEKLPHIGIKDTDNHAKLHNDLLMDKAFFITLDDAYNFHCASTKWYTPDKPRTEMVLYFNSKRKLDFIHYKFEHSKAYFNYLISDKFRNIMGYDDNTFRKHYFKAIRERFETLKTSSDKEKLLKYVLIEATTYSAEKLDMLVNAPRVDKVTITKANNIILLRDKLIKLLGISKEGKK